MPAARLRGGTEHDKSSVEIVAPIMPKDFHVPSFYKSARLVELKSRRREEDPKRRDLRPSIVEFSTVRFKIARHFGFCFGVENAIDIAYRALNEFPGRRIFLLSEIIHNPEVNADLIGRGVTFLMKPNGERVLDFKTLRPDDIVIVPAFGTTLELQRELEDLGINPYSHDTTCPFVQKVWKRAEELGRRGYTVIIHGKRAHEETRATFSHTVETARAVVVQDMQDTEFLAGTITGSRSAQAFAAHFQSACSPGFDPLMHLERVGVVNQTTMLATETQAIAERIRAAMLDRHGVDGLGDRFADTRDTLCYATYENQSATRALIDSGADLAIVVGGYNSSNTSHLVELAQERLPTFYIKNALEILSADTIRHFDLHTAKPITTSPWLPRRPGGDKLEIAITSGASCPDRTVEEVIEKINGFCEAEG